MKKVERVAGPASARRSRSEGRDRGAGIGGLTLGLALRHFGHRFSIHEQSPALREVGAGITLWPNATRLLFALGLRGALGAVAVEPVAQKLMHCETGQVLQTFPRAQATREA